MAFGSDAYKKRIFIIGFFNVAVALVDKIILTQHNAFGMPVIFTVILWVLIYRQKKSAKVAYYLYSILAILATLLAVFGVVVFLGFIRQGRELWAPILMVVVGVSYAISWILLTVFRKT